MPRALLTFFTVLIGFGAIQAQPVSHRGLPFITNYTPRDYGADAQNWGVVQDDRGVMYFGNTSGVLEFDGVAWRVITVPGNGGARWLTKDRKGTIYVSAFGEFGYLQADQTGNLRYASLLANVPDSLRNFTDVFQIAITSKYIYFRTDRYLFRWDGTTMAPFVAPEGFHVGAVVDDTYYVRQWGVGLMRMEDDGPHLVSDGARFAQERIYSILPYDDKRLLIGTRNAGFFLYDGVSFTPFPTEADTYFESFGLYLPGAVLNDGSFVFGTSGGGAVRLDHGGRLVHLFNKESGLQDAAVWFTYVDRSGDLWLALDKGIARIETGSPYTFFGEDAGIGSAILSINSVGNTIYTGTSSHLLRLRPDAGSFEIVPGSNDQVQDLREYHGEMLVGTGRDGLFKVGKDRLILVAGGDQSSGFGASTISPSKYNENLLFIGARTAVVALLREPSGHYRELGRAEVPDGSDAVEFTKGDLWVGSFPNVYRITVPFEDDLPVMDEPSVKTYGQEDGLPKEGGYVFDIQGHLLAVSNGRIYRFDESSDSFLPDTVYWSQESANGGLKEDRFGRVWSVFGDNIAVGTPQPGGGLKWVTDRFRRLSDSQPGAVHVDETGIVWVATLDGLVRYDPEFKSSAVPAYTALVRQVTVRDDSVIYAGGDNELPAPILAAGDNTIRFAVAAPTYTSASSNRYRTWLEGFDDRWSGWSTETNRTYTNLSPGEYRFHVKAVNVSGIESDEGIYEFTILPPWYRTWWAYGLYVIALGASVVSMDRMQRRRLVRKEREEARLREAHLQAEAAAAEAKALQAESDRQKNVELLSEIGQSITATLSVEAIIDTVYESVNALMDAAVFGIGLYNLATNAIDFPATREKGERLAPYSHSLDDGHRLASWCFKHQKEILISDYASEYKEYLSEHAPAVEGDDASSILYLPLEHNEKRIGVITAQSFEKNAYSDYHLNILQNLATYTAIALDNAEAYSRLNETVETLNSTLSDLKKTQDQLVTQEKMASLGQLTAGIAHEIKNPLNFVNNFAELNTELAKELMEMVKERSDAIPTDLAEEILSLMNGLKLNASQIHKHGMRADSIVKSMMQHASEGATERYPIDVNAFVEEYIGLAYHGMKAKTPELEVALVRDFDEAAGNVVMTPQEMGRVLVNLTNNALYAAHHHVKTAGPDYTPTVTVRTKREGSQMKISVIDNGPGIPEGVKDKIFQPLFTTKPAGSGTGLGLSLSFEIVTHGHNGKLDVTTEEGKGATFTVTLPA
jgi:signal transduction histidine kinase